MGEAPATHIENLRKWFREALELLEKGDAVQGSEKLYKIAEAAIKILAKVKQIPEYEKAQREDRWWPRLLQRAARRLSEIYGKEVLDAWNTAYHRLHIDGFHEERLSAEEVLEEAYIIEDLVKLVEREAGNNR
ncbi:PaREP1/PaREP8 domain containing family protein [Staphylothermus marinus F1]|uniref:PaREP1/PaREP8 domain containing family protein n=1 Tax=Staphylothermus marinus (strain ATCC 43588 / DSM 3639 / JCM 9404 / F1) TaxID=399550 RepID=A3DPQ9_STAMF|nr:PaREP1 family protein [Staphylothermus marinus]ABN70619.1 PaREP1/PaREP8 domain containing family protein [Staphylothermus marinus F1]